MLSRAKRLWSSVRPTASPKSREISFAIPFTANGMVGYFTEVATDSSYDSRYVENTINHLSHLCILLYNQISLLFSSMNTRSTNAYLESRKPRQDLITTLTGFYRATLC